MAAMFSPPGVLPHGQYNMNRIKVDEEIIDHVRKRISGVFIVPRWRGK